MDLKSTLFALLWRPDFYKQWHYRVLLSLLVVHTFCQSVGFNINLVSGLDRRKVGILYENALWFRAVVVAVMAATSSLLAALAGALAALAVMVATFDLANYCAYLAVLHHLGFKEPQMRAYIESRTYPLP